MISAVLLFSIQVGTDFPSFKSVEDAEGLRVEIRTGVFSDRGAGYSVTGAAAPLEDVEGYRQLFLHEWSEYPTMLMGLARLKRIVLCSGLAVDGQYRAACPAFDLDTMYYDTTLAKTFPHYEQGVVHHEFFHFLDERMRLLDRDPEWAALNPKDFHYGSGGAKMRERGVGDLTDKIPGFLTRYATAAVEEDKAELFAHMIVDGDFVKAQMAKDPVLTQKVSLLRKRLANYLPEMGDSFWQKVGWLPTVQAPGGGIRLGFAQLLALGRRPSIPAW